MKGGRVGWKVGGLRPVGKWEGRGVGVREAKEEGGRERTKASKVVDGERKETNAIGMEVVDVWD